MTRIQLQPVFDRPDATFGFGEPVTGHVEVRVRDDCRCDRLHVGIGARAKAVGEAANLVDDREGFLTGATIYQGPWKRGETLRYPFRLEPGPVQSFSGRIMDIDFFLQVSARTSAGRPIVEQPVRFLPTDAPIHVLWNANDLEDGWKGLRGVGLALTATAVLLVGLAFVVDVMPLAGVGAALGVFGIAFVGMTVKPWLAERKIGHTEMRLRTTETDPPDGAGTHARALHVTIRTRPHADPAGVRASLTVREWIRRASQGVMIWENELFRDEVPLRALHKEGEYEGTLVLPRKGLPCNILLGDKVGGGAGHSAYEIQWEVKGHVAVENWSDWERRLLLRVRPVHMPFD